MVDVNEKKLPVGIENFEKIRTEGFYYVDKTAMIRDLLHNWGGSELVHQTEAFWQVPEHEYASRLL